MTRNEIREVLMQMMYEMDAAKTLDLETARKLAGEKLPGKNLKRSLQILSGIIEHLDEIDGSINAHSRSWKTSRMPKVDLAIMRLALGEIKYGDDVPEAVATGFFHGIPATWVGCFHSCCSYRFACCSAVMLTPPIPIVRG